mmetsp:Transcript_8137/g.19079  ORF Transcript_8137/g.19079 Transcript_8137/m.19079 type:complete len:231 (+) Transcript_8137:350-1042(+)
MGGSAEGDQGPARGHQQVEEPRVGHCFGSRKGATAQGDGGGRRGACGQTIRAEAQVPIPLPASATLLEGGYRAGGRRARVRDVEALPRYQSRARERRPRRHPRPKRRREIDVAPPDHGDGSAAAWPRRGGRQQRRGPVLRTGPGERAAARQDGGADAGGRRFGDGLHVRAASRAPRQVHVQGREGGRRALAAVGRREGACGAVPHDAHAGQLAAPRRADQPPGHRRQGGA